jgi:hypothetical protein
LEPLNSRCGVVCEDPDEVWAGLVSGRFYGVVVELLDAVGDLGIDLCPGEGTVDTGSLGRVSTR